MVKGTPNELKSLPEVRPEGTRRVAVSAENPPVALGTLKSRPFVHDGTLVESEVHLLIPEATPDKEIIGALEAAGVKGSKIRPIDASLEDVFVTITRRLQAK